MLPARKSLSTLPPTRSAGPAVYQRVVAKSPSFNQSLRNFVASEAYCIRVFSIEPPGVVASHGPLAVKVGSHGMVAAVDVQDLAGHSARPVGQQIAGGAADGFGVARVPPQRRPFRPRLRQVVEAGDALAGHRADGPGRHAVDADIVLA